MAWYKTGTVTVTNNSSTVTGSGTNFVSGAQVGFGFQGPNGLVYEITAINSSTSLTITPVYGGSTASGQSYAIVPTQGLTAALASDVTDLITDYQTVADNAGAGKFGDGSAASPGIRFVNDQDTGFFKDTANEIAVSVGGTKVGEFTSTGIDGTVIGGTTPAAGSFTTLSASTSITGERDGAGILYLNRLTSDGEIARFQKDGTTVGSIGVLSSRLYAGTGDTGLFFNDQADQIQPWNTSTNAARDAAIDLGDETRRFKDLYLSGGVYLGGTGSANKLDDYETGTWTPLIRFGGATTGITYSTNFGSYTKIGRLVYINGVIGLTSKGTASGSFSLDNLPFNVGVILPSTSNGGSLNFHYFSSSTASHLYSFFVEGGDFTSGLYPAVDHSGELNETDFTNSTDLRFNGVYVTA